MEAKPARLDAEGTAKPLTRLIDKRDPGHCFGPGIPLRNPYYENEQGKRTSLKPDPIIVIKDDPVIVPSDAGEQYALFLTQQERDLVVKVLVMHSLINPHDKALCLSIKNKIQG